MIYGTLTLFAQCISMNHICRIISQSFRNLIGIPSRCGNVIINVHRSAYIPTECPVNLTTTRKLSLPFHLIGPFVETKHFRANSYGSDGPPHHSTFHWPLMTLPGQFNYGNFLYSTPISSNNAPIANNKPCRPPPTAHPPLFCSLLARTEYTQRCDNQFKQI